MIQRGKIIDKYSETAPFHSNPDFISERVTELYNSNVVYILIIV